MSVRIDDVAREAGVSTATVSRVLNKMTVKPEMQRRVEEAVRKLDYRPNYMAKGLMERKTYSVGILVPSLSNHYFTELLESIEELLRPEELMVLFCSTKDDPEREKEHLGNLLARSVDGVIVVDGTSENSRSGYFQSVAARVPLVIVNGDTEGIPLHTVLFDQAYGTRLALEHLFGLGHRNIAFVRGRYGFSYELRERAFRDFFRLEAEELPQENIICIPYGNTEEAISMTEKLFSEVFDRTNSPTAILASNDLMATGVVHAAEEKGLRVPQDISVIGHDDTLIAQMGKVKLSSINIKTEAVGKTAAQMLIRIIGGEDTEARRVVFHPELVLRDSCGEIGGMDSL